jgi:hypothetical protein
VTKVSLVLIYAQINFGLEDYDLSLDSKTTFTLSLEIQTIFGRMFEHEKTKKFGSHIIKIFSVTI